MNVKLITLGCPKNLVDSEFMMGGLENFGVHFTNDEKKADVMMINTCGFIESAKEESIDTILEAVAHKQRGGCQKVIVTGCLSERYGDELRQEIPELDGIYGNRDMQKIVQDIALQLQLRHELIGEKRQVTTGHYAYLKISEGCEHPCTFCAIPAIRGGFRSKPVESLVAEARALAETGVKELILIAQDSTQYGLDSYGERKLPELMKSLSKVDGIEWMRLMYAYPHNMTDEVIETIATTDNICNYVDMPVQHTSDYMLKRMARRTTGEKQHRLIEKMRAAIPELALRTSVIVGFPGETEADFEHLLNYVTEGYFDHLGVFTYSTEEGTPAANFPKLVSEEVKRERQDLLIQAQEDVSFARNEKFIGRELRVLVDEYDPHEKCVRARTEWDCPEIDNSILLDAGRRIGGFYRAVVKSAAPHDLRADVIGREPVSNEKAAPVRIPVAIST